MDNKDFIWYGDGIWNQMQNMKPIEIDKEELKKMSEILHCTSLGTLAMNPERTVSLVPTVLLDSDSETMPALELKTRRTKRKKPSLILVPKRVVHSFFENEAHHYDTTNYKKGL
jgi:hypothetical protein